MSTLVNVLLDLENGLQTVLFGLPLLLAINDSTSMRFDLVLKLAQSDHQQVDRDTQMRQV